MRYIRQLQDKAAEIRLTTLKQVQGFWSDVINDPKERTSDRLKASELFAKCQGGFLHPPQNSDDAFWGQSDGSDVLIYLPQLDEEETHLWKDPDEIEDPAEPGESEEL